MKNSTDWNDYAKRTLLKFLNSLGADEINEVELCKVDVEKLAEGSQQDAYDTLRKCISDKSLRRYQNRYRQHKHREQNAISNLQLKESSLRRLKVFQEKINKEPLIGFRPADDWIRCPAAGSEIRMRNKSYSCSPFE